MRKEKTSLRGKRSNLIKTLLLILVALGIGGFVFKDGLLLSARNDNVEGKPVVKIGVSLPLTGDIAYAGEGMKASLDVFMEDLQSKKLKNKYEFILEDNAFEPRKAITSANKLINIDHVDAILDFGSKTGLVVSPIADKNKIIHFNTCASDKTVGEGEYNFVYSTFAEDEISMLVEKIKKEKYKNIIIVGVNELSADVAIENILKQLATTDIKHRVFKVNPAERDMRILIEKTKKENPDLYVLMLFSPTVEIFMKQFREANISTPIMSTHFFANINDFNLIEGAWFTDYAVTKSPIREKIMAKNPDSNYEMCIGYVYDALGILVNAFEKASSKEEVLQYLQALDEWDGAVGKLEAKDDGVFWARPSAKIIKDGKMIVVME